MQISEEKILRHICNTETNKKDQVNLRVVSTDSQTLPAWKPDSFYLANIGTEKKPLFLELRFEPVSSDLYIALLMTNERFPKGLQAMAEKLIKKLQNRKINFKAFIGVETLGSNLSQEMARLMGPDTSNTSFQKGKPIIKDKKLVMNPPKNWVDKKNSVIVRSGTSSQAPQALFMDERIAKALNNLPIVIVDDARLTSGTVNSSIKLAKKMGLNLAGIATVLNEAEQVDKIKGIPYVYLAKIPVFKKTPRGLVPKKGSFTGVNNFYLEVK